MGETSTGGFIVDDVESSESVRQEANTVLLSPGAYKYLLAQAEKMPNGADLFKQRFRAKEPEPFSNRASRRRDAALERKLRRG